MAKTTTKPTTLNDEEPLNEKQTEIKPCYHFNPQMKRRYNINNTYNNTNNNNNK